ncbi:MAG: hypothetical protein KIB00_17530 [Paeniclostridium sordellii]|nr:hypothetical protein [Paeniclostridium sordellii]
MKRKSILLLCMLLISSTLTACSKDEILNIYDKVVSSTGELQLTKERNLVGTKKSGEDDYTGEYTAEYENFTGKEYIFGGTTIDRKAGNEIEVKCNLNIEKGVAKLMFVSGSDDPEVLMEESGEWSDTIKLPKGGNYLFIEADDLYGSMKLEVN